MFCQHLRNLLCFAIDSIRASPSSSIRINDRTFSLIRLIGEGGFSYVYLVKDTKSGCEYALKKIRCPPGTDTLKLAKKEIAASSLFDHPKIIRIDDHAIIQESDGSKTVYLLLPYFRRGTLQDLIDKSVISDNVLTEDTILHYAKDICIALAQLHNLSGASQVFGNIEDDNDAAETSTLLANAEESTAGTSRMAYAHFDLKPANLMVTDEGGLVLMDFGSCKPARTQVTSRTQALQIQDEAAEHSTMPYRAPELFDCPSHGDIDEKVDIWSLGCLLYALAFGHSPFETTQTASGSIALAVMNCQYNIPSEPTRNYSEGFCDIIRTCLRNKASLRPSAQELEHQIKALLNSQDEAHAE